MKTLTEIFVAISCIFLVLFGLVQCSAPNKLDIRIAEYICKSHHGLYERNRIAVENKVVVCNDGSRHNPANVVIKK